MFGSYQACILVRQDVLAGEPRLRPALDELSGKFTNEMMRKLNAAVDVDHRAMSDVAAAVLAPGRTANKRYPPDGEGYIPILIESKKFF